jgi:C4-dicarboxylate transporter
MHCTFTIISLLGYTLNMIRVPFILLIQLYFFSECMLKIIER